MVSSGEIWAFWPMLDSEAGNESALRCPNVRGFFLQCLLWNEAAGWGAVHFLVAFGFESFPVCSVCSATLRGSNGPL